MDVFCFEWFPNTSILKKNKSFKKYYLNDFLIFGILYFVVRKLTHLNKNVIALWKLNDVKKK
jgi:uncharacterized protein YutD